MSGYCSFCQLPDDQCQHGLQQRIRATGAIACSGGRPLTHGDVEVVEGFTRELRVRRAGPPTAAELDRWAGDAQPDEVGRLFEAAYRGQCQGCGDRWEAGSMIAWSEGEEALVCSSCASL